MLSMPFSSEMYPRDVRASRRKATGALPSSAASVRTGCSDAWVWVLPAWAVVETSRSSWFVTLEVSKTRATAARRRASASPLVRTPCSSFWTGSMRQSLRISRAASRTAGTESLMPATRLAVASGSSSCAMPRSAAMRTLGSVALAACCSGGRAAVMPVAPSARAAAARAGAGAPPSVTTLLSGATAGSAISPRAMLAQLRVRSSPVNRTCVRPGTAGAPMRVSAICAMCPTRAWGLARALVRTGTAGVPILARASRAA